MLVQRLLIHDHIANVKCLGNVEFLYLILLQHSNCHNRLKIVYAQFNDIINCDITHIPLSYIDGITKIPIKKLAYALKIKVITSFSLNLMYMGLLF